MTPLAASHGALRGRVALARALSRPAPRIALELTCSDCDGTGLDPEHAPPSTHYLHPPSGLCRECRGRGTVEL